MLISSVLGLFYDSLCLCCCISLLWLQAEGYAGKCKGPYYEQPLCVDKPDGYECECGPGFDWNTHLCISTAVDSAFQFTQDAYSSLQLINSETELTNITISAWLKLSDINSRIPVLVYTHGDGTDDMDDVKQKWIVDLELALFPGEIIFMILGQVARADFPIDTKNWFHITCTCTLNTGEWKVYKNGQFIAGGYFSPTEKKLPRRGQLTLGRYSFSTPNGPVKPIDENNEVDLKFVGEMAHVHIWSHVMEQNEITSLYNDCLYIYCGDFIQWTQFRDRTRGQMKMKWPSGIRRGHRCFTIDQAIKTCDRHCSRVIGPQCNEQVLANVVWRRTHANQINSVQCPTQHQSSQMSLMYANRSCLDTKDLDGVWDEPMLDDCIAAPLLNIKQDAEVFINLDKTKIFANAILKVARRLQNQTRNEYLRNPIEIATVIETLKILVNAHKTAIVDVSWMTGMNRYAQSRETYPSYEEISAFSRTFISTINNMMHSGNAGGWQLMNPQGQDGDKLMQIIKSYIGLVAHTLIYRVKKGGLSHNQAFITIKRKQVALKIKTHPSTSVIGMAFPDSQDEVLMRMQPSKGTIAVSEDALSFAINKNMPEHIVISSIRMKILPGVLPNHNLTSKSKDNNVNSPVFGTYIFLDNGHEVTNLSSPVKIHAPYLDTFNISNPECVSLQHGNDTDKWKWTTEFCHLIETAPKAEVAVKLKFATCACSLPGLYTITSDMYDDLWDSGEEPNVLMEIPSYVGCGFSTVLCLFSLTMLIYLRTSSNTAAIHKNFSGAIILAKVSFMFGIDRIHYELVCQSFAICLHYFVLASFSWLMNEAFNLYIVITYAAHSHGEHTESSMWRYYILGWILPIILVGTFVGTNSSQYYAPDMCWIAWENIWLFAGPIIGIISISILVLTFTAKEHHESSYTKNEKANKVILIHTKALWTQVILLTLSWTFAFISIMMRGVIVKYLFALFDILQGAFFLVFYFLLNDEVRTMYKAHRKKRSLALQGYDFASPDYDESGSDMEEEDERGRSGLQPSQNINLVKTRATLRKRSEIEASSNESSDDCAAEMVTSV